MKLVVTEVREPSRVTHHWNWSINVILEGREGMRVGRGLNKARKGAWEDSRTVRGGARRRDTGRGGAGGGQDVP